MKALARTTLFAIALASHGTSHAQSVCKQRPCVAVGQVWSDQPCEYFQSAWSFAFNCNSGWQQFQSILEVELAKNGNLQLVERNELYRVIGEQEIQHSIRTGSYESFRASSSRVNYLVYGKITELGYEETDFREAGYVIHKLVGTFAVDVKLVEVATGRIKRTANIRINAPLSSSVSTTQTESTKSSSLNALYGQLQRKAAESIASKLSLEIFPLRIVRMTGTTAFLNHGSQSLRVGEQLTVLGSDGMLVDPDTGRQLGDVGVPIGTLRITSTSRDYSIAEVASGNPGAFAVGQRADKQGDGNGDSPSANDLPRTELPF